MKVNSKENLLHFAIFMVLGFNAMAQNFTREMISSWQFKQENTNEWLKATVPGCVHLDLLENKKIPDPYYRNNEKELQWIDRFNWEYKTVFQLSVQELKNSHIDMIFKGLDTYADVYVNDQLLLKADNMYREWVIDIKKIAKADNNLRIVFRSAVNEGLIKRDKLGYDLPAINDFSEIGGINTKKVSVFTRKAPYHFGWDWGPRFVTSGVWRPVHLHFWNAIQLDDFFISTQSLVAKGANMKAKFEIWSDAETNIDIALDYTLDKKTSLTQKALLKQGMNEIEIPFVIANPKLWWTKGMGAQHLYKFKASIKQNDKELDSKLLESGIRTIVLVRKPDAKGKTFYFELNGKPVYIKGSNYIPNEVFLPRTKLSTYEAVINAALETNQNMLRVWGGGIYEEEIFYQLCDKNGILVWQDFMFACAMYPGDADFLSNVESEVGYNIKRLRNHPSIALWCGNNEMDAMWTYWGVQTGYTEAQKKDIWKAYENTFYDIIPKQLKKYHPEVSYWSSSPITEEHVRSKGGIEKDTQEILSGDLHCWSVWFRNGEWEYYNTHVPRFMSEFGAQAFPEMKTIQSFALPEDYAFDSPVMKAHQRSGPGNELIQYYIERDYRKPTDFADFLYLSQLVQGESMKVGIEAQRRAKPHNMGVMYWQINDCWPGVSWSSMDYFGRKKALHFVLKQVYAPLLISAVADSSSLSVVSISEIDIKNVLATLNVYDLNGKLINSSSKMIPELNSSKSIETFKININDLLKGKKKSEVYIVLNLKNKDHSTQNVFYLDKMKNFTLPKTTIKYTLKAVSGGYEITFTTDKLTRYLAISSAKEIEYSDNYFDLIPLQNKTIMLKTKDKLFENDLQIKTLNPSIVTINQ